ncbi:MAG: ChaN family lipoprotein [Flavobacteriaceae bacterium]
MKTKFSLLLFFCFISLSAQDKKAYQFFNAKGKKVSYKKVVKKTRSVDVLFFGELHNNAIAHWLQLELTKDLDQSNKLILGAEMFERDNQIEIDTYLKGSINQKELDTTARLWPNYKTDYKPLLDYAKDNNINFVATNIPRKYASQVYRGGFEALDTLNKQWMAPLPIAFDAELPRYKAIMEMMGDHGSLNLVKAQAVKDATMAFSIKENFKNDHLFIHYNGAYHSDFHEGILWYLNRLNPELKVFTITTVSQDQLKTLNEEYLDQADLVLVVDSDMTNTY